METIKEDIQEMKNYVIDELTEEYYYTKEIAKNIVKKSSFNKLINEEPDYVFHYNVSYWAEEINKEYKNVCIFNKNCGNCVHSSLEITNDNKIACDKNKTFENFDNKKECYE